MARTVGFYFRALVTDTVSKALYLMRDLADSVGMTALLALLMSTFAIGIVSLSSNANYGFRDVFASLPLMFVFATIVMGIAMLHYKGKRFVNSGPVATCTANISLCFAWMAAFIFDAAMQKIMGPNQSPTVLIHVACYFAWFCGIYYLRYHTKLFRRNQTIN